MACIGILLQLSNAVSETVDFHHRLLAMSLLVIDIFLVIYSQWGLLLFTEPVLSASIPTIPIGFLFNLDLHTSRLAAHLETDG